jgi:hypothetical protein
MLVSSRVTKFLAFQFAPAEWVYADKVVAVPSKSRAVFAVLSSTIHFVWAELLGTNLGGTFNYQPTECAATFAAPGDLTGTENIGSRYHEFRRELMLARQEGLTKTYNRFHNLDETSEDIARLRALHVEMDQAVAAAYGWSGLHLGHDFHETKQGVRYTLSESARRTVLDRLLALNHQRYEEEVRAGLHEKGKAKGKRLKAEKKSFAALAQGELIAPPQPDLFGS